MLFGIAAEILNSVYIKHKIESSSLDLADMHNPLFLPFICTVLFAASSHLLHRYWRGHPVSLVRSWQVVGLVAVTLYALLDLANRPYFNHERLSELLTTWLVGLGLAAGINLILVFTAQAAAGYYTRAKKIDLS